MLVDIAAGAAVEPGAGVGALGFGLRAGRFGLGLLQVLAGDDAGVEQLTLALQRFLREPHVGPGLGGVGLGDAEVRRSELRQHRAGLDRLADIGLDCHYPAGEGRVDALGAFFVPDQPRRQLDDDRFAGGGGGNAQQRQLRMAGCEAQLVALQDGRGRFRRRLGGFGATRQACEQAGGKGQEKKWTFHARLPKKSYCRRSCQACAALACSVRAASASSSVARRVRRASISSVNDIAPLL